ncbi:MAG: hypothetical protein KF824_06400 [Fimbriimonadaceae bacterium]|nr:MAG: hypothetical protein KF824_06400 [Fimbriimonadaceae bacterium]
MITSLFATVLANALVGQTPEAYFPLVAGTVRIYEQEVNSGGKKYKSRIIETVQGETTIKRFEMVPDPTELDPTNEKKVWIEEKAIPVTSSVDGNDPEYTYYKTVGDRVFIVGTAQGELLIQAFPILAFPKNDDRSTWLYSGNVTVMGAPAPTLIEGEAYIRKAYKYKNKEYPAIESKATYKFQLGGGIEALSEQTSIYAKGIGLVEFSETGRLGKEVTKVQRRLVQIDIPTAP